MCIYNVLLYLSSFKINGVWVMSDIDWSKAPEGTTHYSPETGEDNPCWVKMLDSGFLYKAENHFNKHKDTPWMKGSFNFVDLTIKPKPESKPVYTQAMADNGELQLVGMEVMSMGVNKIVRLPPDTNRRFLLESVVMGIYDLALIEGISTIKPPIELIDGKAYQFDYNNLTRIGLYNKDDDRIMWLSTYAKTEHCTNIQLLEVKS